MVKCWEFMNTIPQQEPNQSIKSVKCKLRMACVVSLANGRMTGESRYGFLCLTVDPIRTVSDFTDSAINFEKRRKSMINYFLEPPASRFKEAVIESYQQTVIDGNKPISGMNQRRGCHCGHAVHFGGNLVSAADFGQKQVKIAVSR